jgi:DNA polymerase III alpha subunit
LEFYAAALRNHSGMYPLWAHINEARRVGILVVPPAINRSGPDFAIEGTGIRTGLGSVKHLARGTIDAILAERRRTPFSSLADFLSRVPSDREETLTLVSSGAFDEIEPARCQALAEYLAARGRAPVKGVLALGFADNPRWLPTQAFTPLQMRRMEYSALGFSPLVHPLEFFSGVPGEAGTEAGRGRSGPVAIRGLLAALRHYRDRGAGLWFATLDNPEGLHETIIPEGVARDRFEVGAAYAARGTVERRFGAATLKVGSIHRLSENPG